MGNKMQAPEEEDFAAPFGGEWVNFHDSGSDGFLAPQEINELPLFYPHKTELSGMVESNDVSTTLISGMAESNEVSTTLLSVMAESNGVSTTELSGMVESNDVSAEVNEPRVGETLKHSVALKAAEAISVLEETLNVTNQTISVDSDYLNGEGQAKHEMTFPSKTYNVTDYGVQALAIATCPITWVAICPGVLGTKTLRLEDEEAYYEVRCCLCHTSTRRPYGELGSVDSINCLCCQGLYSELFQGWCVAPGCGCRNDPMVAEIVSELKSRMKDRGDTGQIRRTEQAHEEIKCLREEMSEMKADLKTIMRALKIDMERE